MVLNVLENFRILDFKISIRICGKSKFVESNFTGYGLVSKIENSVQCPIKLKYNKVY